ncbi:hypothetical protein HYALB_00013639, partial [Hymenoscyphus albidus]
MDLLTDKGLDKTRGFNRMYSGEEEPLLGHRIDEECTSVSRRNVFITLPALFLALFLAAIDATVVAPALPTIADYFQSQVAYIWVGSGYLLTHAACGPLWGKFSDIWGRKVVILVAVCIFFVGSLLCGTATNVEMLIAGRVTQGSAAGGLIVLVNICISDLFDLKERGFYLALTGIVWALASGTGPLIGGAIADNLSWRWIWFINLPLCGLTFFVLLFFLDVDDVGVPLLEGLKAVDWVGSITILASTVMLLASLELGGVTFPRSSPELIGLIVGGLVLLGMFFLNESKFAKQPVVPMSLFQKKSTAALLLVVLLHGLTYTASQYYLPLYFQAVGGASALGSGLLVLPTALTQTFTAIFSGLLVRVIGSYMEFIWCGMAIMTIGYGLFIDLSEDFSMLKIVPFQIIAGIGIGMGLQTTLVALQSNIDPRRDSMAATTATFSFVRNLGCCISVALGGIIFQNGMKNQKDDLVMALGPELANKFSAEWATPNAILVATLPWAERMIVKAAYVVSLKEMWVFYTCCAGIAFMASLLVGKPHITH